jgi:hypothetical protein
VRDRIAHLLLGVAVMRTFSTHTRLRLGCTVVLLAGVIVAGWSSPSHAGGQSEIAVDRRQESGRHLPTPPRRHWTVNADNDLFVGQGTDRGYTGGLSITLSGSQIAETPAPTRLALRWFDRWTRFSGKLSRHDSETQPFYALQIGTLAMTPEALEANLPVEGDRPFASMGYITDSHYALSESESVLYQSSFTLGLIGTSIAEQVQKKVHKALRLREPAGYGQQISEGGELTARYAVARHALLRSAGVAVRGHDLKFVLEGGVGFLTEVAAELALRWGRRATPWWVSASDRGEYAAQPAANGAGRAYDVGDFHLTTGVKVRARAYNVFLQGQFRESPYTLSGSQLRPFVAEAWLGVVRDVRDFQISYTIRFQTAEMRNRPGGRSQAWASLAIGKNLR